MCETEPQIKVERVELPDRPLLEKHHLFRERLVACRQSAEVDAGADLVASSVRPVPKVFHQSSGLNLIHENPDQPALQIEYGQIDVRFVLYRECY